jgi:hypothetical protein
LICEPWPIALSAWQEIRHSLRGVVVLHNKRSHSITA